MATKTLSALRTEIANRINFTVPAASGTFITISEANACINNAINELRDVMIQKYGADYFATTSTISLVNGTEAYSLPSDFFKLLGVDYQMSNNEYVTLTPYELSERNRFNRSILRPYASSEFLRYRIRGSQIIFSPIPTTTNTVRLIYVPLATALSADGDTFECFNGWDEYVITDCCIKWLAKEESSTTIWEQAKLALKERIESAAGNRDAGFSPCIADVRRLDFDGNPDAWGYNR